MNSVIGVDVGSQSVKGVLLDADGSVAATASAPLVMSHPESGWAEQDPASWETALETVVGRLLETTGAAPVAALGLASQVDGVVAMDRSGAALRPGIIWLDRRAADQTDRLVKAVGDERLFDVTGLNPDASHSAPKMMWLREHEPQVWRATTTLAPVGGYLLHRLTGIHAQDPANASSSLLYDVAAGSFSAELCEAAGVDPDLLPPIAASTTPAGTLTAEAASRLGLPASCQVVVGTGDEHAATFAAGAIAPGVAVDVTGTAEPVTAAATRPVLDESRLVETHAHAVPGRWLVENPGFVSGGSTLWLAASVLRLAQADLLERAGGAPAGSDGVLFLPTLSGATAPRWNDAMRGVFAGLSMNHDAGHLARAVLEGCAYALRDIVDRLAGMGLVDEGVRVVGGGARSRLWLQIKADVLGRPLGTVVCQEATALGAAMIAAVGAGVLRDVEDAVRQAVRISEHVIEPDPASQQVYAEGYRRYRALYDGVEGALA